MIDVIPLPKKNVIFDSQILTALMKCARYAHFTYDLNRRPSNGKSNALECGSIVHAILEHYYKARINGVRRNDAIDAGYEAGKEYLVPYKDTNKYIVDPTHIGVVNTPEENVAKPKRTGWKHVFKTMQEYFDYWRARETNWTPLYAEHVIGRVIYEDDELRILYKAKFDLIDDTPGGIISTDHKTMSQVRDTLSLNNQFLGHCIILNTRQVQVNKIGFQTSLPPEEKFLRPLLAYSMDRIVEHTRETIPYYARMYLSYHENEYFPPNFAQCEDKYGYCMFKNVCERDRNARAAVLEHEYVEEKKWDVIND